MRIAPLLLPGALIACATAPAPVIPGCYEGPCVAIGESQRAGEIEVVPLAVREDSRCPIEADCVGAGRVRINAQLTIGHEVFETELTSWEGMDINGGTLTLVEVAPDASSQWPNLQPEDYRFRFEFED